MWRKSISVWKLAGIRATLKILLFFRNKVIFLNSIITTSNNLTTFTRPVSKNHYQGVRGICWIYLLLNNNQIKGCVLLAKLNTFAFLQKESTIKITPSPKIRKVPNSRWRFCMFKNVTFLCCLLLGSETYKVVKKVISPSLMDFHAWQTLRWIKVLLFPPNHEGNILIF